MFPSMTGSKAEKLRILRIGVRLLRINTLVV
jgi:hypothetical protein